MMSITEIIYEEVEPGYGWGRYGEFRVLIRLRDGYINVTKLCKDGDKKFKKWSENSSSKDLVNLVSSIVNDGFDPARSRAGLTHPVTPQTINDDADEKYVGISADDTARIQVLDVVHGGPESQIRGTYAHPLIVPQVASWVSNVFAIMVSRIVNDALIREYREQIRVKDDKIDELMATLEKSRQEARERDEVMQKKLDDLQSQNEEILLQNDVLQDKVDAGNENTVIVLDKLGAVSKNQVPPGRIPPEKRENLWILHCPGDLALQYHVLRAQYISCLASYKQKLKKDKGTRIVAKLDIHPNPREEYLCFRQRARGLIFCFGNKFRLNKGVTEQQIVDIVESIHAERLDEYCGEVDRLQDDDSKDYPAPNAMGEPEGEPAEAPAAEPAPVAEAPAEPLPRMTATLLFQKTMAQLKDIARAIPKRGWSKLPKDRLVPWIMKYQ